MGRDFTENGGRAEGGMSGKAKDKDTQTRPCNMRTGGFKLSQFEADNEQLRKKDDKNPGAMCDWPSHNPSCAEP